MKIPQPETSVPIILLLLGVLYLGYVLSLPQGVVFFSGDGGLKYLMAEQYVAGRVTPDLELEPDPVASELWQQGLYPFGWPFVYDVDDRRVVSFPMYFSLATAPLLSIFGWRGLYLLPAAGLLLTWIWVTLRARAAELPPLAIGGALVSLIFASPLTLYGGIFWEHAPAAFFPCVPLFLILRRPGSAPRMWPAIALGSVAGAGVFLRPEIVVVIAAAIGACLACLPRTRTRHTLFFALGCAISLLAFLVANLLIYGGMLGLHSDQVVGLGTSLPDFLRAGVERTSTLATLFGRFWSPVLFVLVGLPFVLTGPYARQRELIALCLVVAISIPVVSMIVPNDGGKQWGPRYLLPLIPWGAVAVGLVIEAAMQRPKRSIRVSALVLLALTLGLGIQLNAWSGTRTIDDDYRERILPALRLIESQPERVVLVPHQWMSQEMAALVDEKSFLWFESPDELERARLHLAGQGVPSSILVTFTFQRRPPGIGSYTLLGQSESYSVLRVKN